MRRILRVGMIAVSLAGTVAVVAPTPAKATTKGAFVVTAGRLTVSSHGIAFPLLGSDTGQIDRTKTPQHFSNSAAVHLESTVAVGTGTTTKKSTPVEAGAANIVADGWIHGYCGTSEGTLHGTASVAVIGSGSQHYSFSLSWTEAVPGTLAVTGHITKHGTGHSGPLEGSINIKLVPGSQGTCLNKGAKDFDVDATLTFTLLSTPTSLRHVTLVHTSTSLPG